MNTLRFTFGLLISVAAGWAVEPTNVAPVAQQAQPPSTWISEGVEVIHDVVIGTGGGRPLHVNIARPQHPLAATMPAVLWIHGGGWEGGSHQGNGAAFLAQHGYFTATLEYRLSGEATWPAQLEDCKLGVRWLRANAAKYHVDPDHIGCAGHSAGGHLAACLGTMGDRPELEGQGGFAGVSSRVQAVVDYSGPTDFTHGSGGLIGATADHEAPILIKLFGGTFKEKPEVWRQGSPLAYADANSAPFLIVHGDQDHLVPMAMAENLTAVLKQAGVPVDFIRVKNGDHGLRATQGRPPAEPNEAMLQNSVLVFLDKYLKK